MKLRLLFALPLFIVAGCKDDRATPPASEQPTPPAVQAAKQPGVKPLKGFYVKPPKDLASADAAPLASVAPSASAMPEPPPSAGASDKKNAAPNASAKAEPTAKKDSAKPGTSADAAPPAPSASAVASPAAPATVQTAADLVAAQIDAIFLEKKTFSAKFKQEHTQKVAGVTKKSTGVFFFERPNKMSFRYDAPSKNRIVSDGQTLKVYIGEDNQMFVQSVDKTEYPGAFAFLMGKGMAPSFNFNFNEKAKFDGGPVLLGKPKEPTPHYDSVRFHGEKVRPEKKEPGVIRRFLIFDAQGNRNRFDLEGATQPEKIDPAEFTFTPPAGTNITQN